VLVFATPLLCQSRVCGPVVDIALQVEDEYRDKVKFIHMEVYRGNDANNPIRPQLAAFRLQSEPWAFVIGKDGRIVSRIEGAYSASELEGAVKKALKE
jgi:hypothetical protein